MWQLDPGPGVTAWQQCVGSSVSVCQYANMPVCQYEHMNMSVCPVYGRYAQDMQSVVPMVRALTINAELRQRKYLAARRHAAQ